jgi:uncharacterized caspase-like protein
MTHLRIKIVASILTLIALAVTSGQDVLEDDAERGLLQLGRNESPLDIGNRWALLIGINEYEHMPPLRYCARDAEALKAALIEHAGYEPQRVYLLSDAAPESRAPTRGNILIALSTFLQQAKPEDTVLLAFSGHGERDSEDRSYLMPIDGLPSLLADTGLPVSRIYEYLDRCTARQKVVILDACHSGGKRSGGAATSFDFTKLPQGTGIIELLSCDVNEVSWENAQLQQGVFSHFLTRAMEGAADSEGAGNGDGYVSVDEVYAYVHDRVRDFVREKHNQNQTPKRRGEVKGSVFLASRKRAPGGLSPDQIAKRMTTLSQQRKISEDLASDIRAWQEVDETFEPWSKVRLLLSLLTENQIDERQFRSLTRDWAFQIQSHLSAARSGETGTLRAVVVGANKYPNLSRALQLNFAVADAKQVYDLLTRNSPTTCAASSRLFLDQDATKETVVSAIRDRVSESQAEDLLVVFFAGHAASVAASADDKTPGGIWLFSDCTNFPKPSDPLEQAMPRTGALSTDELTELIAPSAGSVLILSDAPDFAPPNWPNLAAPPASGRTLARLYDPHAMIGRPSDYLPRETVLRSLYESVVPERFKSQRNRGARVFVGFPGQTIERPKVGGYLTYLLGQALMGAADQYSPLAFAEELPAYTLPIDRPDGYVTLRELVKYLQLFEAGHLGDHDLRRNYSKMAFLGSFGARDVVLTRSELTEAADMRALRPDLAGSPTGESGN